MAKLRGPLLSFGAIGRLGKNFVIRRHGKDHIAETYPHPRDAKTPAQLSWRHMYQKAVALWHALSDEEKADWERLATPRHMTGYAWFLSQCLKPNPGIYLPLQGGSMQGSIAMNFNRITTLPVPGAPNDPARLAELATHQALTSGVHGLKGEVGFSVHQTSAQTIPDHSPTILDWHTEEWDVGGYFNLVNNRFTPLIPGKYLTIGGVQIRDLADGKDVMLMIYKNGIVHKYIVRQIPGAASLPMLTGLCIVYLNGSTDYIQLGILHYDTVSRDTYGNAERTFFQGFLIGQT